MNISFIKTWFVLSVVMTLACGLMYLIIQQSLRMNANDPQIQMAQDAAVALSNGAELADVVPTKLVNIKHSLAPFVIVFDATGKPLSSNATADGEDIGLPKGVFQYTQKQGEDRITWQPQKDIRSAAVIVSFSGKMSGFVLVGRSLKEVESRTSLLFTQIMLGWFASIIIIFVFSWLFRSRQKKEEQFVMPSHQEPTYNLSQ